MSNANSKLEPLASIDTNEQQDRISHDGFINSDNNVLGTYLHGLFDNVNACKQFLTWAGLDSDNSVDLNKVREQQLDRLADCLREHLDDTFWDGLV